MSEQVLQRTNRQKDRHTLLWNQCLILFQMTYATSLCILNNGTVLKQYLPTWDDRQNKLQPLPARHEGSKIQIASYNQAGSYLYRNISIFDYISTSGLTSQLDCKLRFLMKCTFSSHLVILGDQHWVEIQIEWCDDIQLLLKKKGNQQCFS